MYKKTWFNSCSCVTVITNKTQITIAVNASITDSFCDEECLSDIYYKASDTFLLSYNRLLWPHMLNLAYQKKNSQNTESDFPQTRIEKQGCFSAMCDPLLSKSTSLFPWIMWHYYVCNTVMYSHEVVMTFRTRSKCLHYSYHCCVRGFILSSIMQCKCRTKTDKLSSLNHKHFVSNIEWPVDNLTPIYIGGPQRWRCIL